MFLLSKAKGQRLEERKHVHGGFGWNLSNRCGSCCWFYYPHSAALPNLNSVLRVLSDPAHGSTNPCYRFLASSHEPSLLSRHSDTCWKLHVPETWSGQNCLAGQIFAFPSSCCPFGMGCCGHPIGDQFGWNQLERTGLCFWVRALETPGPLVHLAVLFRQSQDWNLRGGPVAKTPHSQCRGLGFDSRSGN